MKKLKKRMKNKNCKKRILYALLIVVFTLINYISAVRMLNGFIEQSWIRVVLTFGLLILYLLLALGVGRLMDKNMNLYDRK